MCLIAERHYTFAVWPKSWNRLWIGFDGVDCGTVGLPLLSVAYESECKIMAPNKACTFVHIVILAEELTFALQ